MDRKTLDDTSKFLSYVLRHQPEAIGLTLDGEGWADIDALIAGAARDGRALDSIRERGLVPGSRHHVHLSARRATALEVGRRYGSPVLLEIDARDMHLAGHLFHQAENGVWLTERVPVRFIREA
ncbi:TPA: RNA 2'-phosphotransferase [Pseudomonas aeruginosa]